VEFPLPQNTVTVDMTHQITGARASRNLRWDEQVTTEEPFEVAIGNGKVRVELALLADDEGSPLYKYKITDELAGIDHEGTDVHLGHSAHCPNRSCRADLHSSPRYFGTGHRTRRLDAPSSADGRSEPPSSTCSPRYPCSSPL
jgi:hypothetical protein